MATIETKTKTIVTISKQDRQSIYNEQHGLCACCKQPLPSNKRGARFVSQAECLICGQCQLIVNGWNKAINHFGGIEQAIEAMATFQRNYIDNPHCWLNGVRMRMNDDQPPTPTRPEQPS